MLDCHAVVLSWPVPATLLCQFLVTGEMMDKDCTTFPPLPFLARGDQVAEGKERCSPFICWLSQSWQETSPSPSTSPSPCCCWQTELVQPAILSVWLVGMPGCSCVGRRQHAHMKKVSSSRCCSIHLPTAAKNNLKSHRYEMTAVVVFARFIL